MGATLIYFYADWCSHCKRFLPTCEQEKIQNFPTVRLYRRGALQHKKAFQEHRGARSQEALESFLAKELARRHLHAGAEFHEVFSEGCRLMGHLEVARVPGTLFFH